MNVLILAAGDSHLNDEDAFPVWLTEIDGTLVLERQVESFRALQPRQYVFMFRQSDIDNHFLREIVEQIAPGSMMIGVRRETAGAACTALLAAGAVVMDEELIVASATDHVGVDYAEIVRGFRQRDADAGVLSFQALHPRYSFIAIDEAGFVAESAEKRPISRNASAGIYWFKTAADFFDGTKQMILKDAHVQGKFYVCPVLNQLILRQRRIAVHHLTAEQYHPIKSARQVERLERDVEGSIRG